MKYRLLNKTPGNQISNVLFDMALKYMYGYKKEARTIVYSFSLAPQGPLPENTTMSTPLLLRALPFLVSGFEFCGFD
ncbi:hypothetical protein [Proteiniphilum sp.]|uniref:hypothetical protein n=1 Tax=Proteiniphilum sp. TaxID=1926877 RepID=UPI003330CF94